MSDFYRISLNLPEGPKLKISKKFIFCHRSLLTKIANQRIVAQSD